MKALWVSCLSLLLVAGVVMANRMDDMHANHDDYENQAVSADLDASAEVETEVETDDDEWTAEEAAEYSVDDYEMLPMMPMYSTDDRIYYEREDVEAPPYTDPKAKMYSWPAVDADNDGVFDRLDRCPSTKSGMMVDACGCPMDETTVETARVMASYPVGVEPEMRDAVLRRGFIPMDMAFFDFDETEIKPAARTALLEVAEVINAYPTLKFEISGHADSRGEDDYNKELSRQRANAVREYLIEHGHVRKIQLVARGFGENRLATAEDSDAELQANRRVEFRVVNPEAMPRGARFLRPGAMDVLAAQVQRNEDNRANLAYNGRNGNGRVARNANGNGNGRVAYYR